MKVLNFEDSPIKHRQIRDVLESCGIRDVTCVRNLEDGVKLYHDAAVSDEAFDLIISDMWYPSEQGGTEEKSGELLIERAQASGWNTPIILCSSQNYMYPEVFGCLYYSENEDWEGQLRQYINRLM